jgi:hypothetical protein
VVAKSGRKKEAEHEGCFELGAIASFERVRPFNLSLGRGEEKF